VTLVSWLSMMGLGAILCAAHLETKEARFYLMAVETTFLQILQL